MEEMERKQQEEQVKLFTDSFLKTLFDIGSRKSLPERLQFKGVNCVRNFTFGDTITFNIVFGETKTDAQ